MTVSALAEKQVNAFQNVVELCICLFSNVESCVEFFALAYTF